MFKVRILALAMCLCFISALNIGGKLAKRATRLTLTEGLHMSTTVIPLENVKNLRDLQTASPRISIVPSKVFRTGCVSKASESDVSQSYFHHSLVMMSS